LTKKSFLPSAIGEINVRILRELKRTLDPKGILNPGKIFDSQPSTGVAVDRSAAN
jgi:FAD/FMN-containing dehydrogenase